MSADFTDRLHADGWLFASMCPPKHLSFLSPPGELSTDYQAAVVRLVFQQARLSEHPVSHSYRATVLKAFVRLVEASGAAFDDALLELYQQCVLSPPAEPERFYFQHFTVPPLPDSPLVVRVNNNLHVVGHNVWPAGLCLSDWLLAQHASDSAVLPRDALAVELGAGNGLAGVVLARAVLPRRCRVLLTDYTADVLDNLRLNVALNGLERDVVVAPLDWTEPLPPIGALLGDAEQPNSVGLVIGADLVYSPDLCAPLAATLTQLLVASPHAAAVIVQSVRRPDTWQRFVDELERRREHIAYQSLPLDNVPQHFIYDRSPMVLLLIRAVV